MKSQYLKGLLCVLFVSLLLMGCNEDKDKVKDQEQVETMINTSLDVQSQKGLVLRLKDITSEKTESFVYQETAIEVLSNKDGSKTYMQMSDDKVIYTWTLLELHPKSVYIESCQSYDDVKGFDPYSGLNTDGNQAFTEHLTQEGIMVYIHYRLEGESWMVERVEEEDISLPIFAFILGE